MSWVLPFHLQRVNKLYWKYNQSGSPSKKNICWYGTQKLPKTWTFIFITTKQKQLFFERQSLKNQLCYGIQLFKFFQPYRKYIKAAKNGGFCEELLSEKDCFRHFPLLWLWYNASEEKHYHRWPSCVVVWWISKIY